MKFSAPLYLLLAATIPWMVIAGRKAAVGRTVIALRSMAALAIVMAAAGLAVRAGEGPASIVFALDRSQSIGPSAQAHALQAISRMAARMRSGDQAAVVAFGAEAVVDQPMARTAPSIALSSDLARGATNIESALGVSRALLPRDGLRRIVLLSDGNATTGDALREAGNAAGDGVAVDVVPLATRRDNVSRVMAVTAPDRVAVGEPFDVTATLTGSPGSVAAATLLRDGETILARSVTLDENGVGGITASERRAADGIVTYTAGTGDEPGASGAGAAVAVQGRTTILYVTERPGRINRGSIRVEQRSPALVPSSFDMLARFDAIVLDEVSAESLGGTRGAAISEYVTRRGGGLLLRGTDRTLGPAGYPQSPLDAILPVDFRGRKGSRSESMAMVVAFDKSGSMADRAGDTTKIEMARRSVLAVHDVLPAGDSLGVIAFDAQPSVAMPLEPKGAAAVLRERLRTIEPGGPTRIAPALRMARDWLNQSQATRRRILLMSDGRSDAADAADVLALFRDTSVGLTIVAAGDDSDRDFFRQLASSTGAEVYFPEAVTRLPAIAAREAVRATGGWRVREPTQPRLPRPHPITAGVGVADLPIFAGYIAAARRADAESVIESHLGDPLLAAWRAGLGRVAVVTTNDATADTRESWARVQSQALRWTARDGSEDGFGVRLVPAGGQIQLEVDAVSPDARFVNGLRGTAVVRAPEGEMTTLDLHQTAPGRYAARFEPASTGTHVVSVALRDDSGREELSTLRGLYWSSPAENSDADVDLPALAAIARAGTGRLLDTAASPFDLPRPAAFIDLSRVLAGAGLILFVIELAVRRGVTLSFFRRRASAANPGAPAVPVAR